MPKCPACTAENSVGVTVCEYCGSSIPKPGAATESASDSIERTSTPVEEVPKETPTESQSGQDKGDSLKSFKCESCGAVVTFSAREQALNCAYCGSNYVVDVPPKKGREKPKRIVPFSIEKNKARELFKKWIGKGFWRPRDLKKTARMDRLLGVYLPFWSFDVHADSTWTASAGYHYMVSESYTTKEGKQATRQVRKTRWEPANGQHKNDYNDWLVSASGGLEEEWVRRIVPFSLDQAKPYTIDFLAGWAAEEYSIEPGQAKTVAEEGLRNREEGNCTELVPGDTHKNLRVNTTFRDWLRELLVLPIWISSYKYKGEIYRFLVNGQTGEVVGKAPVSKLKIVIAIILGLLAAGGIAAAIALQKQ